jgi:hypothetical protein
MFRKNAIRGCSLVASIAMLCACGSHEEYKPRSVTSFEFASCNSVPTTDATHLEAINAFNSELRQKYFVQQRDFEYVANHESGSGSSGVRQYKGPFYIYVHPRKLEKAEQRDGVDWAATVLLHAMKVRARSNGQDWGEWNSVRTRNFAAEGRTVDQLGRWKCLMGAEIAWANVTRKGGQWTVTPLGVSVYESDEVRHALPTPSGAQIDGKEPVEAAEPLVGEASSAP